MNILALAIRLGNVVGGAMPIVGGFYCILMAKGIVPRNPKDPERMALWRRKFGKLMMILGPIIILGGILQILGLLD